MTKSQQTTRIISATIQGIVAMFVALCVMSLLCGIVAPEAFGVHPALLGIALWGTGLAFGIMHGRAIWKKRQRPAPRELEVITDQQPAQ